MTRTLTLSRTPEAVWRAISDSVRIRAWRRDIIQLEHLPDSASHEVWREIGDDGRGTRGGGARGTAAGAAGDRSRSPRRVVHRASGPMPSAARHRASTSPSRNAAPFPARPSGSSPSSPRGTPAPSSATSPSSPPTSTSRRASASAAACRTSTRSMRFSSTVRSTIHSAEMSSGDGAGRQCHGAKPRSRPSRRPTIRPRCRRRARRGAPIPATRGSGTSPMMAGSESGFGMHTPDRVELRALHAGAGAAEPRPPLAIHVVGRDRERARPASG